MGAISNKGVLTLLELKANVAERVVEGYASTWDLDDVGDQIVRGAFKESLEERHLASIREKGRSDIRVLWQHEHPIGVLLDAREDDHGLWIKVRISKTSLGDDVLQLLADGAVDRMSIGYMVPPGGASNVGGVRVIRKCSLWEVSFVTFPANPATSVDQVKSGLKDLDHAQLQLKAQKFSIKWSNQQMEVKQMSGVSWDQGPEQKAGRVLAGRNVDRVKSMLEHCKGIMEQCEKMLEEASQPNARSQDAGGRGEPPSNHTAERDERKSDSNVTCPHCKSSFTLAGDVGPMGQPEPCPESIANNYPGPYPVPAPKPESIAELVPPLGQPEPQPESIAGRELIGDDSPNYSDTDEAALQRLAEGSQNHTWSAYTAAPMPTPGNRPGGPGPYPVPTPHPYSVAGQNGPDDVKESNVSSSLELKELVERLQSLSNLVSQ